MTVEIPEPFRSALHAGRPKVVSDVDAPGAEHLFARGLARSQVGRASEARADFLAAQPVLGDACLLEIGFLDLREHSALSETLKTARAVIKRAVPSEGLLAARARHLEGL